MSLEDRKRLYYNKIHYYIKKRNQELLEDGLEEKNENLYTERRNVQKGL